MGLCLGADDVADPGESDAAQSCQRRLFSGRSRTIRYSFPPCAITGEADGSPKGSVTGP